MGAYIGERKIGYMSLRIEKEGPGYNISSTMQNHLTLLGADLTQLVSTTVHTDSDFSPLEESFSMTSGGKTTTVHALFAHDQIKCSVSAGSGASEKIIPIPKGTSLIGDAIFAGLGPKPQVGKHYKLHYFNPLTLAIEDLKVIVERSEKVELGGKKYDTFVIQNVTPMGDMTVWQEAGGEIVQVKAVMGIMLVRQTREQATADLGSGPVEDMAELSRAQADREIKHPRRVKSLEVVVEGLHYPALILSDDDQKAETLPGEPGSVKLAIVAANFDKSKSITIPISKPDMAAYLAATPYLDYDAGGIKDQAKAIVGNEKSAYLICSNVRAWIHANMRVRADIGITRPASDVLKSKQGVCRDYAVLFAALARSSGVPTRIASGLLYTQGAFYYHAWVECYVGKWVPFDATLPVDFVDATHIKLAEGDATAMFGLAKVIGSLKMRVLSSAE